MPPKIWGTAQEADAAGEVEWTVPGHYGTISEQQCMFWEEKSFLVFDCVALPSNCHSHTVWQYDCDSNSLSYTDFHPHNM